MYRGLRLESTKTGMTIQSQQTARHGNLTWNSHLRYTQGKQNKIPDVLRIQCLKSQDIIKFGILDFYLV